MSKAPPRLPIPGPTLPDRAIGYFAPRLAAKRMQARMAMSAVAPQAYAEERTGGWTGLLGWRPRLRGPNDVRQIERDDDRARSREMIRTDPIAAGAINVNVAHVVGTGLTMQPAINYTALGMTQEQARVWQEDVATRFLLWATSQNCDAAGRLDFYEQQALALTSVLASGDVFALLPQVDVPGWPYRLGVQLIEADRVCNRDRLADVPGQVVGGVVMDRSGRPVGYEVANMHPHTVLGTTDLEWSRIAATGPSGRRNMIHLYEMKRPDQVRGIPYLAGVIGKLKELSRYSEAELHAAVTAAAMTVFTRMDPEAFEAFTPEAREQFLERANSWDGSIVPGTAVNLFPGEDLTIPKNERPNANFDPFFLAIVRQIGVGLELPFEVLIKHFTSSYSAARASMLDAWRTFRRRRDWLAKRFCQPIYEEWLADEIAFGRIQARGFFEDPMTRFAYSQAQWIGDGPGSIDPEKEVKAAVIRMREGISTLQAESILHDGVGWEVKHPQREAEVTARRKAGLEMDPAALIAPAADPESDVED